MKVCVFFDKSDHLQVIYAADIQINKYINRDDLQNISQEFALPHNWGLMNVNSLLDSLLQFNNFGDFEPISGINVPWLYFGMLYSTFCWHTEDLYLYSINYMHQGAPKIWYSISHKQKEEFDEYVKNKFYATLLKQPDLIHKLIVHIHPLELIANGIKVFKTIQHPGEIVITVPKGYHTGFSLGYNVAEAVNFSVNNLY